MVREIPFPLLARLHVLWAADLSVLGSWRATKLRTAGGIEAGQPATESPEEDE
jgi:hypothetical protein